jgi:hypothetical protein
LIDEMRRRDVIFCVTSVWCQEEVRVLQKQGVFVFSY